MGLDRSLLYDTRPAWRRDHRIPMLATLSERSAGHGQYACMWDDVTAAGGTDPERVWAAAEGILRDALEGAWLGSSHGAGRLVALRYSGPVLGEEHGEWIELVVDLRALTLLCELLGLLTGYDYNWPWAPTLIGEYVDTDAETA